MDNIKDFILDNIFVILFVIALMLFVVQFNNERGLQRTVTDINERTNNFNLVIQNKVDESNYYVGGGRVIASIIKSDENSRMYINGVEFVLKDFYNFTDFNVINPHGKYKKEEYITENGTSVYYQEIGS